jgi:hypothetical protein
MHIATFETPSDLFEAMFGPLQHDAHVQAYRGHHWLIERSAANARAFGAVMGLVDQINARHRARYDTKMLDAAE